MILRSLVGRTSYLHVLAALSLALLVFPPALQAQGPVTSIVVNARSRPTGFGTGGVLGPVYTIPAGVGTLTMSATGTWCRFFTMGCSGPNGASPTGAGPIPGAPYNLLGGQWQGGPANGTRVAIGSAATLTPPISVTGIQFFFNDDINTYNDNTSSIVVTVTANLNPGTYAAMALT